VELAESVSIAMLTVLETLSPVERAVFVLREVFAVPYEEIAEALDKTPAAARQIAHRARGRVEARRPRIRVTRAEQEEAVERLLAAIRTGDVDGLLNVLAPDVVAIGDGGGLAPAARLPIQGARRVAKSLLLVAGTEGISVHPIWINGALAIAIEHEGKLHAVTSVRVDGGRVTALYGVNNPEKLTRVDRETQLAT
jgi:RNA polymerase sigma-70 factor (ECF subfamily)